MLDCKRMRKKAHWPMYCTPTAAAHKTHLGYTVGTAPKTHLLLCLLLRCCCASRCRSRSRSSSSLSAASSSLSSSRCRNLSRSRSLSRTLQMTQSNEKKKHGRQQHGM